VHREGPGRKRPLGRPSCRQEDNIKTDLQETGWQACAGFIRLSIKTKWRALVNKVMNPRVPQNAGNFLPK